MFGQKQQVTGHRVQIGDDHALGQIDVEQFTGVAGVFLAGVVGVVVHRPENHQYQAQGEVNAQKTLEQAETAEWRWRLGGWHALAVRWFERLASDPAPYLERRGCETQAVCRGGGARCSTGG
ncbi:MAG: hypothetical protein B0D88_02380 [Candidatus Sedimenticola endophacoides]|nr:MAG: hypothetical protein B0D88_02380 [Candidatus Sedimenticola endophacoides]OQX47123.1 MAG: hypothetical protein B0D86_00615 [Candidatus Sedimenticola endophacoides]